jgi:hypothetical protein
MALRIRQVVFVASDLEQAAAQLAEALQTRIVYRDPQVAEFGLMNALLPVGDQFVEVVTPTRADAAAARQLARHGNSAYMLILQTDDLAGDRRRLRQSGVRIVWQSTHPDMAAIHLHPKDIGGAIVSLDQPEPAESWRWAGPQWRPGVVTQMIREIVIASPEPRALALRWAEVLGTEAPHEHSHSWCIRLSQGSLSFVPAQQRERIVECVVEMAACGEVDLCGTRFKRVPPL